MEEIGRGVDRQSTEGGRGGRRREGLKFTSCRLAERNVREWTSCLLSCFEEDGGVEYDENGRWDKDQPVDC
jgi:hypothetical protein